MNRVWHRGPPPHIGWWNASDCRNRNYWRWWNGKWWSLGCLKSFSAETAGVCAQFRGSEEIEWTTYYPSNARVPRIKP